MIVVLFLVTTLVALQMTLRPHFVNLLLCLDDLPPLTRQCLQANLLVRLQAYAFGKTLALYPRC